MFLLGLPFSPIRTRRLPKRVASPAQNPWAGFRNTGQGVSLHRGPSALPRKDPLNNSLITISTTPCQALSSFSLAGSVVICLPLYGPGGRPPCPYPGTATHPGGLARRPPDAPPG